MTLRFVRPRAPSRPEDLDATDRAQVRAFGKLYDGKDAPIDRFFGRSLALWRIEEDGKHRFDAIILSDSGVVFEAGKTREVLMRIQGGFTTNHLPPNPAFVEAVRAAFAAAKKPTAKKKVAKKKR